MADKEILLRETARRYYRAKSREERLAIRKAFCLQMRDEDAGRFWDMITLKRIDPDQEEPFIKIGAPRGMARKVYLETDGEIIEFGSLREAERETGYTYSKIHYIAKRHEMGQPVTYADAPKFTFNKPVRPGRPGKPVLIDGKEYPSVTAAAREIGYTPSALVMMLKGSTMNVQLDISYIERE